MKTQQTISISTAKLNPVCRHTRLFHAMKLLLLAGVVVGANGVIIGTAGAAVDSCGAPPSTLATGAATFLWQNCATGTWTLSTTGGRSATNLTYIGTVTGAQAAESVVKSSIETTDLLDNSDPSIIQFLLLSKGTAKDAFDFKFPSGAPVCVNVTAPTGVLLVGPSRTPVSSPVDLRTMGPCGHPYLEDADTTDSVDTEVDSDLGERPFPRITTGPIRVSGTAEQFSKYDVIEAKSSRFSWMATVQAINPDTAALRIHSPFGYQGYGDANPCAFGSGMPFNGTGPATTGCEVYAGHWLYAPGSPLLSAITATTTSVQVSDPSRFTAGRYIVIYDGGAGAFLNAEHARVTAVNTATKTLTLSNRGMKSTARSHPAGAILAEHVIGNGDAGEPEIWVYNHSTTCPLDASGKRMNQVMAEWLAANYNKDQNGKATTAKIAGVMFDTDFHFIMDAWNKKPDVNNDLVLDEGISPTGVNLWGQGLDDFYTILRERIPNALIVGGMTESRGFTSLNGNDMEAWPQRNIGDTAPDYRELDGRLSQYSMLMHHGNIGPRYSQTINRVSTLRYTYYNKRGTSNAPFRFSLGLTLLDDGYYAQENNTGVGDPWWDEYAVDVVPGSPTFGRAIASNPANEAQVRQHKGWMGFPLGPRSRIYDQAVFAPERNLLTNGNFDTNLTGWSGTNVSVTMDTAAQNRMDGTGALHISPQQVYAKAESGAAAKGPTLSLQSGVQYTLAYAVKSSAIRTIQVAVGDETEQMTIPAQWSRQVFTFTAPRTGNFQVKFNVGRESTDVWVDSVYLFAGNADVFRRDFDNAVVVVNATPTARTVDLGGTFQRIRGTGQDPVNDGAAVTQVTLPAYDAIVLVRP